MQFYHEKFREIRLQKKISLTKLALKMEMSRVALWTWENGRVRLSEKKIRELSKALNISTEQISDLRSEIPVTERVGSDNISSLLHSFAYAKMGERKKKQSQYLGIIRDQFDDFNQIISVLDSFLNTIQLICYAKDFSSKYMIVNQAFLDNVSRDKEYKILGREDKDFFSKKEAEQNTIEDEEIIATGKSVTREGYIPGSKKKKWGIITKVPLFDYEKKIVGVLAYFTDITRRKKAELLVENFKKGLESMDETIWMAKSVEKRQEGAFFNDFLYPVVNTFIQKAQKNVKDMPLEKVFEHAWHWIVKDDKRIKLDLDLLKKNKTAEVKYMLKFPNESRTLNMRSKIYYNPELDMYSGILREDAECERIEKIIAKLRKLGIDEDTIKDIVAE